MEYFIYFIALLGIFQIISNLIHLTKGSKTKIGDSAKRQHQEISTDLPAEHFYYKALIMFVFGWLFLVSGILAYFVQIDEGLIISVIPVGLYGIVQAIIYKKPLKVWIAGFVYNIPMIVYLMLLYKS